MSAATFPGGLVQPEGAYRFGLEALLLAAFGARELRGRKGGAGREAAVAELGAGCGATLLGFALLLPRARCVGLERETALVEAARVNAEALGLAGPVHFCVADAVDAPLAGTPPQDLVLANPPWGEAGRGRPSPSALRERALRGGAAPGGDAFSVFCQSAARLLRHKGAFCCIVPTTALPRICAALEDARLGLRRILPLAPRSGEAARRLLLLAQKGAAAEPQLLAPLILHSRSASPAGWTRSALAFCPWLAAGPAPRPGSTDAAPPGGTA